MASLTGTCSSTKGGITRARIETRPSLVAISSADVAGLTIECKSLAEKGHLSLAPLGSLHFH